MIRTLIIGYFLFPYFIMAQVYEPEPCEGSGNADLKKVLSGGTLESLYLHGCGPGWTTATTSSFLKASGAPPTQPDPAEPEDGIDDGMEDYYMAFDQWSCTYAPSNLLDGNTATAWVEGASGQGVGEVVMIPRLDLGKPIQIWNGYGKSEKLYQYNSRIKNARIHIFRGEFQGAGNCGAAFKEIIKVASLDVNLLDKNGFQSLSIPTFQKDKFDYQGQQWDYSYWLAIEIVSVYPGSKWADTCISEVRNN